MKKLLFVCLAIVFCLGCVRWWRNAQTLSKQQMTFNAPAEPVNTTVIAPNTPTAVPPTVSAALATASSVSREMNVALNPYAGGLREPGKSKRAWDANYIKTFQQSKNGDAVRFELTDGVMTEGVVKIVQLTDGNVTFVSGELTAPEAGKFFFLTPPAGGKAGSAVGVIEFPASKTAYRIEPTGANGEPELWRRRLDEVVCMSMPEIEDPAVRLAATNETENIIPLRPDLVPDVAPSYNSGIISLQSYPGASGVMLLDFFGGYTVHWGGVNYAKPPVGNSTIKDIWKRVAEDYMPFNINVTTDIKVYLAAPASSRQRCCFTTTPVTAAGVAYFGSWNWGNDAVCWSVYYVGKAAAEVAAHEVGHTLGLSHQGQDVGTNHTEYYSGQGSGATGWSPIMGVGYYQPVTTWAKGEYANPSQTENELQIIATANNNVAYRVDDAGNTLATSRYLEIFTNNTAAAEGVIERTGDTDAFQFTTTGGTATLSVNLVGDWANLAVLVTLADASDTIIASNNPQSVLTASISTNLPAGTYTFRVTGAGRNDPLTNGFSTYASLGYYSVTGSVAAARQPTRLSVMEHATNNTVVGTVVAGNSNSSPLVYAITSGNTGGTFSVDNNGVVTVANSALLDYYKLSTNTALYAAQFEVFMNITNVSDSALTELNRRVVIAVQQVLPAVPLGVVAQSPTPTTVNLNWNYSTGATSYRVKRSTTLNGTYTLIGVVSAVSYTDITVSSGNTYYYVISAVGAAGESSNSIPVSVGTLPLPWMAGDVGSTGATGNAAYSNSVFTVNGSGGDIWGTADALQYVYQAVSGDCDIRARVVSLSNTSPGAKAGVMIRAVLTADSAQALVDVQPAGSGVQYIYRTTTGGSAAASSASGNAPVWVRLTRTNNTVTGYYSLNGTAWTSLGAQSITLAATFYVGLAVCSHSAGTLCTGVFSNVTVAAASASAPATPTGVSAVSGNALVSLTWNSGADAASYNVKRSTVNGGPYTLITTTSGTNYIDAGLAGGPVYYVISAVNAGGESADSAQVSGSTVPPPWIADDIGSTGALGNTGYSNGVFTVNGSGGDIWGTSDGLQFVYQTVTGNCDIRAHVLSLSNTSPGAKAGVMIRGALTADSAQGIVDVQPAGSGVQYLYRTTAGGSAAAAGSAGSSAPIWVRLTRTNNTVAGYYSFNGTSWTSLSSRTITLPTTIYVGLAVCSHNAGTLCTGVFDNVSIAGGDASSLPATPTGVNAAAGNSFVSLNWNASASATSYIVKRAAAPGGPYVLIATSNGSNFNDTGVTNGATYYYVVSAVNLLGESFNSSTVSAMPVAPVTLVAQSFSNGNFSLQFAGVNGQSYVIEMSTNLTTWTPLWTNIQTGGLFTFNDTNAVEAARFYRAKQ